MRLEVGSFPVRDLVFGARTAWTDGVLEVDRDGIIAELLADPRLATAELELARPGESVRIWPVRDVIEPMVKVEGPGVVYPGMSGRPTETVGRGRTHRLTNVGVVEVSSVNWHEAGGDYVLLFLEMQGQWAEVMPYGSILNLCLVVEPDPALPIHLKNQAVHNATLTVCDRLAAAVADLDPPESELFELTAADASLPKVVYVMGLHSPQAMSGSTLTFGNGTYGQGQLAPPWVMHPNEILDGAVTGPYRTGFATSWTMSHNPVLLELYRRHGVDLNFLGVIVVRTEWTTSAEKQLIGEQTAKVAQMLGAEGAVVTWDAGGNEFIEIIRTVQACERLGVKTVFLTSEDSSEGGVSTMLEPAPEADAIVSTGFQFSPLMGIEELPAVERVIGLKEKVTGRLRDQVIPTASSMPAPYRYDDHYGFNRLSAIDY
jgi:glycine reductase